MKILTAEQIRKSEEKAVRKGISLAELMQNAGNAAAEEIIRRYDIANKSVLIVCGVGNNGGDGFVMANRLSSAGADVSLYLPMGLPRTPLAAAAYNGCRDIKVIPELGLDFDFYIDALFGIGLDRGLDGALGELIDMINEASGVKISVDVPSGVGSEGKIEGKAFKADLTLTMIAAKLCFFLPPANEYCGEVVVLDIGAPVSGYSYLTVTPSHKKPRGKNCHKGSFGNALIVAGSYGMCGAEILASRAALRAGAGIVRAVVCDKNYSALCSCAPETVTVPVPTAASGAMVLDAGKLASLEQQSDAMLIGCGMGNCEETARIVASALTNCEIPTVLDADGINALSSNIELLRKTKAPLIITPHSAEMARLCKTTAEAIELDRIGFASRFALKYDCIVVLKGANTVIASNEGDVYINTTGNAGLASAGSGDVLAGIIVAYLAAGRKPLQAAMDAVYIHGAAADSLRRRISETAMLASDIIEELKMMEV